MPSKKSKKIKKEATPQEDLKGEEVAPVDVSQEKTDELQTEELETEGLLLPIDNLLSAGIHIGTRVKTRDMEPFIFRIRPDGLFVLDVKKTDERMRAAAKFIARFEPSRVVVTSARLYGQMPVKKYCEATGAYPIPGRFMPGLLSNPLYHGHLGPHLLVVTDPKADRQAVSEASLMGIPVVSLCDTDNEFSNIDFAIPTNNKGRRALATIYWLLARQVLMERGDLPDEAGFTYTIDDFETKLSEEAGVSEEEPA